MTDGGDDHTRNMLRRRANMTMASRQPWRYSGLLAAGTIGSFSSAVSSLDSLGGDDGSDSIAKVSDAMAFPCTRIEDKLSLSWEEESGLMVGLTIVVTTECTSLGL